MRRALLALMTLTAALGGCTDPDSDDVQLAPPAETLPALPGFKGLPAAEVPLFSAPLLIDTVRAGGEPVIAITHEGTLLVAAHPGWTHYHPSEDPAHVGTEILSPANAQSYLWRSTDGGATWSHIGLPGLEEGPRGTAFGVSDPEFTVMEDGTVCYTDLEGLAMSSVACSTDDGLTWLVGNPLASGGVNDRQWLASKGDELYFTANYFVDHHLRASTDRGLTWEDRGDVPCAQDLVANARTGHLVVACDAGVAVSEDDGRTWSEVRRVPEAASGGQRIMAEPAIDAAGHVWVTYTTGESGLFVAGTPDEGLTWPWRFDVGAHFALHAARAGCDTDLDAPCRDLVFEDGAPASDPATAGTYVWPWISAGSDGRFAVTWIGTYAAVDSATHDGPWSVFTAFFLDATAETPRATVQLLTPEPIHVGPICQSGTTCQATSLRGDDAGDRRLGDFFETTIDAEGFLHGTWSNTARQPDDVVSHPEYVRQAGGVRLLNEEDLGVFFPTQG